MEACRPVLGRATALSSGRGHSERQVCRGAESALPVQRGQPHISVGLPLGSPGRAGRGLRMGVPTLLTHMLGRGGHSKASLGMKLVQNWEQRLPVSSTGWRETGSVWHQPLAHLELRSGDQGDEAVSALEWSYLKEAWTLRTDARERLARRTGW